MSLRKQRYINTCFKPTSNWVDSRSRRGTTLPGVVRICHTSGSDASRGTSGLTAVFTPLSTDGRRTLRSLTVEAAQDSDGTLWNR